MSDQQSSTGDGAHRAPPVPRDSYPTDFDGSPLAMSVVDLAGRIQEVNDSFTAEVGVARDDVIGSTLSDLWSLSEDDEREASTRMEADGVHFVDVEPAADRPQIPSATLQYFGLIDEAGHRVGSAVSAISTSTKHRLQQRSLDPDGWQLSFDQVSVGMLITGIDGKVTSLNAACNGSWAARPPSWSGPTSSR